MDKCMIADCNNYYTNVGGHYAYVKVDEFI